MNKKAYYQGLAEHITSRIRTFANVKGYVSAGIKGLKISAVLDGRTTNICREMNGRVFITERLNSYVDKAININNETALKKMLPMRSGDDVKGIKGIPSNAIPIANQLPPYHWRCRTRTVAYFEEFETENERIIKKLNNYELNKKDMAKIKRMSIESDMKGYVTKKERRQVSWQYHAEKHGVEFGTHSLEEYQNKVYNIIRNPRKTRLGINKGGELIVFYEKNGLAVKVLPLKEEIYTAYGIVEEWQKRELGNFAKYQERKDEKI